MWTTWTQQVHKPVEVICLRLSCSLIHCCHLFPISLLTEERPRYQRPHRLPKHIIISSRHSLSVISQIIWLCFTGQHAVNQAAAEDPKLFVHVSDCYTEASFCFHMFNMLLHPDRVCVGGKHRRLHCERPAGAHTLQNLSHFSPWTTNDIFFKAIWTLSPVILFYFCSVIISIAVVFRDCETFTQSGTQRQSSVFRSLMSRDPEGSTLN